MLLLDYLNINFPSNSLWTLESLTTRFMEVFGVTVKNENDLYLFKYDMIAANWQNDLTRECRGVILRNGAEGWVVVSRPFCKFFNQHEGHSGIYTDTDFNSRCENFEFHEKGDGTCIQMWFDEIKNIWRVSTLGTITTSQVGDIPNLTFSGLFWKVLFNSQNGGDMDKFLDYFSTDEAKNHTFIFELCAAENRILTKYEKNTIFILAARNKIDGIYMSNSELEELIEVGGFKMPSKKTFKELGINNLEDARNFVESESKKIEIYGEYPEGFVIYENGIPVAKMKNRDYVDKHHAIGAGDILHTRNVVIERFFLGTLDDLMDVLVDAMKEFSEKIREWWVGEVLKIDAICKDMRKLDFPTQKEYALYVQDKVPGSFKSFFFMKKEEILSGYNITLLLNEWIKDNWKKFEKEIKSL